MFSIFPQLQMIRDEHFAIVTPYQIKKKHFYGSNYNNKLESLSGLVKCLWVRPGANFIKLFTKQTTNFCNKLEFLSFASLSRIVLGLQVRQDPTQVKLLSVTPIKGRHLDLPINNRLGRKGLSGTNALAYYEKS